MRIEIEALKRLIDALHAEGVGEFEYQDDEYRIRLVMNGAVPRAQVQRREQEARPDDADARDDDAATEPGIVYVTSPFVGTFYRAPGPDAEPFVREGDEVAAGDAVCIVEAMKLMNEIESDYSGTVVEVLAENGASVEYGQRLFKLQAS